MEILPFPQLGQVAVVVKDFKLNVGADQRGKKLGKDSGGADLSVNYLRQLTDFPQSFLLDFFY